MCTFTDCISEIKNTQVDNAKDTDVVKPMYNLIEYSNSYLKTSGILWQYCRNKPAVNSNGENVTNSFNSKVKITSQTDHNSTKNVEKMVPLKYFSNFRRTLEMLLISS